MTETTPAATSEPRALELVGTSLADRGAENAVRELFAENGTVYLITGFFTANAYRSLRSDVLAFLDRSAENELVLVVGSGADQFSASIARDLWRLDAPGTVRIYRYPHGFLHAKLYVRAGPSPAVVIGSANLTRVAFEQNLEVGAVIRGGSVDDPAVQPFLQWVEGVVAVCQPLRRRDLSTPVRLLTTVKNWSNKGRLLPVKQAALPFVALLTALVWRVLDVERGR